MSENVFLFMSVFFHVYIRTHIPTHMHTRTSTHARTHTRVYIYIHISIYRFIQIYQYLRICVNACTFAHIHRTQTHAHILAYVAKSMRAPLPTCISHVTFTCEMIMHTPTHMCTTVAASASASTSIHILALATYHT